MPNQPPSPEDTLIVAARARYPHTCKAGKHGLKTPNERCYDCRLDAAQKVEVSR